MADIDQVYLTFEATLNHDPTVRAQAEAQIAQLEAVADFMTLLMQILTAPETPAAIRQAVAVYFKNRVQRSWDLTEESWDPSKQKPATRPISLEDKTNLKDRILDALIHAPNLVKTQIRVCLTVLLASEYPDNWPQFIPHVRALLTSNDMQNVAGGVFALHGIVKVYQWKNLSKRGPLLELIEQLFPSALDVGMRLMREENAEAADMLRLLLKAYHASMQTDLSDLQRQTSWLTSWGTLFIEVVRKQIPTEALPEDNDERQRHVWWRAKKWAYNCLNLLFCRYGNRALDKPVANDGTNSTDPKSARDIVFAKQFVSGFAIDILRVYMQQVDLYVQGKQWISTNGLHSLASYFSDAVKHTATWNELKPYSDVLISRFIFPMMCYNDADEELWENDPVEYINKKLDPMEDYLSPFSACRNLLIDMAKDRRKHTFLGILTFAQGVLMKYLANPADVTCAREKDGALNIIICLSEVVLGKKSPIKDQMEHFFVTHIFPEFRSPHKFLRTRACEAVARYDEIVWSDQNNLIIAYQSIAQCMQDPELPVRVQAALTLTPLLEHEPVREAIGNDAPKIMEVLLELTNKIDIDTLSRTMDVFVETFADQLTPYAAQLAEQLRNTFLRMMSEVQAKTSGNPDEYVHADYDEAGDKTMAAMGVMKTVGTLIMSLEHTPEVLSQLEEIILPIVRYVLENNLVELFDEAFEILDSLTYSAKAISPVMWSAFELIYKAFKESGPDFIDEMLPSLDNYITYGKDVFMATPALQEIIMDMVQSTFHNDRLGEHDYTVACKLMESVLQNCRGGADAFVPKFLDLIFAKAMSDEGPKTKAFRVHCLQTVANCLFYNADLTLRYLDSHNWASGFFDLWAKNFEHCTRVTDKKLIISAICALLELTPEQQSPSLHQQLPKLLEGLVGAFKSLPDAIEKRKETEKMYGEYDEGDDDDATTADDANDEDGEWDDDEDVNDEDNQYLQFLASQANAHAPDRDANSEDEEDEDNWDDRDDTLEEDITYESPLDNIDVYIRFQDVFNVMQASGSPVFSYLTNQIPQDQQALLHIVLETATKNRANIQAATTSQI